MLKNTKLNMKIVGHTNFISFSHKKIVILFKQEFTDLPANLGKYLNIQSLLENYSNIQRLGLICQHFCIKILQKQQILTSVWTAKHPNTGLKVQKVGKYSAEQKGYKEILITVVPFA